MTLPPTAHHSSPQLTKLSKGTTVGMASAHCGIPNASFAIAQSFRSMYKHVLMPSGGYRALSSLSAAIQAKETKVDWPLPRLLG